MSYITPAFDAADFDLNQGPYASPRQSPVAFNLGTFDVAIVYPRIPGVLVSIGSVWRTSAKYCDRGQVSRFGQASTLGANVAMGARSAELLRDCGIAFSFQQAAGPDQSAYSGWGLSFRSDLAAESQYREAQKRDILRMSSHWKVATVKTAENLTSPFLASTPAKDLQAHGRWYSSALHALLWRKSGQERGVAAVALLGRADINLNQQADMRRRGHFVLCIPFDEHASQPKDTTRYFKYNAGTAVDMRSRVPWGDGRAVDITRALGYPDYNGPLDDGGVPSDENTFTIPTLRI